LLSKIILPGEISPFQFRLILVLSPVADLSAPNFYNHYPVIPVIHLKHVLPESDLRCFIKRQMMPDHLVALSLVSEPGVPGT
jgi:hypothetical protein